MSIIQKASFLNTRTCLLKRCLPQHPYVSISQQLPSSAHMCVYYSKASFLNTSTFLFNSFLHQHRYVSVTQKLPSSTPIRLSFSTTSFLNTYTSQLLNNFLLQHSYVSITQKPPSSTPVRLYSTVSSINTHTPQFLNNFLLQHPYRRLHELNHRPNGPRHRTKSVWPRCCSDSFHLTSFLFSPSLQSPSKSQHLISKHLRPSERSFFGSRYKLV